MSEKTLGEKLAPHLPYVRRYARALTGSQQSGDAIVRATLQSIVEAPEEFPRDLEPRIALYKTFEAFWRASEEAGPQGSDPDAGSDFIVQKRLADLTPKSRRALLLTTMEGFSESEAATLLGEDVDTVRSLVREATDEIDRQTHARVLIIEDEPIIAMDIETIVTESGHDVAAIAVTRDEAVAAAKEHNPTLVLADIQLADNSSGIDAVKDILSDHKVPVIFITAFPERLLTGEKPEPAFLITKPFQRDTVKTAIAQALFFDGMNVAA
ncbi:response regulator [Novosphingopyxis iocasae]|uniref:response regulator n=1 Tax=Novosphingopyxis iocasae TaxID=2762729 RepID=UPI000C44C4CD|nr:response regulator [Novosphingopyxis iocasae]MAC12806.1 response regulator [Sphingorhabdus sp.]|tara:strand:+ start:303 stop:1106 length:804 start_codon:yes stop_codon:yes gene_type:complete